MCGITGFIDFKRDSSLEQLQKMNRAMVHRGPDGEGYKIIELTSSKIGLGHRRLSIIDLSEGGAQPMVYGDLTITFNGEVYNYLEIREELKKLGHSFKSHSDTEVILHAYAEWGPKSVDKFIGMFVIVIVDQPNEKVFICRDRAGVKPLFYYWQDDLFLFGSELKALNAHTNFKKEINHDALAAYFKTGYIPAPYCIFENTQKLNPGHHLTLNLKDKEIEIVQYWNVYDAYNKQPLDISFDEAKKETVKLLKSACDYRMVSDVPVGVFLSGGYDSSCVTALLQANATEKIKTFTIGVPDAGMNEAPFAKEVANYLGTDHTEYYCTEKEALDIVPKLPFYYDEPFADSSAIPTTLVSKIAREKVTVALSADAGDEVFAGYNRYDYLQKFGKQIKAIPAPLRKIGAGIMNAIPANKIPFLKHKYLFPQRYEKIKNFLENPSDRNMMESITNTFLEADTNKLLLKPTKSLITAFDSEELKEEFYSSLHFMMAIDYETYLPDDILQKVDRATMSVSLEGREPFLDQRVIEWAAQLPLKFKYNDGSKKYILKEIVHDYIPKKLLDRPKMGFGIPIATWLLKDLKPFVDAYFDEAYLEKQGLFNIDEVKKLKGSFYHGKVERAEKIWYLLMFQMWYEQWMSGGRSI